MAAAYQAAGACVEGVDLLLSDAAHTVFCGVRTPGHHAERHRTMGSCRLNNVSVAAAHALEVHGLDRVAIVDFDAHYGNGTEDIFGADPRVLFCSVYQPDVYPQIATDAKSKHIKVPLAASSSDAELGAAVEEYWLPALDEFAPQLLVISAGFDGHLDDDLAQWNLVEADYSWLTTVLRGIAERHAQGRIISVLEGG